MESINCEPSLFLIPRRQGARGRENPSDVFIGGSGQLTRSDNSQIILKAAENETTSALRLRPTPPLATVITSFRWLGPPRNLTGKEVLQTFRWIPARLRGSFFQVMKFILFTLLPLSFLLGSLSAQEEEVPPKFFRFIPLGELPMWEEELVEGIRKGKKPPEGSMPPNPASIMSGEAPVPLRLSLRAMSDMVKVSGATPRLTIKEGELGAAQNWLTEKMPTAPLSLGVLFRNPQTMNWKQSSSTTCCCKRNWPC